MNNDALGSEPGIASPTHVHGLLQRSRDELRALAGRHPEAQDAPGEAILQERHVHRAIAGVPRCVKSATQTDLERPVTSLASPGRANERRLDRGRSCAPGGAGRSPDRRPGASVERPGPAWRGDEVGHGHAFGAGMGSGCGRGCNQDGATHVSAYLRCRVSTKRGGGAYWWIDATCGRDGAGRGACVLDHLDVAAQLHCAFLARCVRALTCRAHAGETLFSPGVRSSSTCTVVSFDPWCLMATKRS